MAADGGDVAGWADDDGRVFSAESTRRTLQIACASVGLDASGAELMRLGENAIYRLVSVPLVARIARTIDYLLAIETEVAVARWLESVPLAAVRLAGPSDQPVVAAGRVVTFWELLGERTEFGTIAELAALLRDLHSLEPPSSLNLPLLEPFGRVEARLDGADMADRDREFLRARLAELREQYDGLIFTLRFGPVHGDANVGNVLRRQSDGVAVLVDLDGFAFGPREWDLVLTAMYYERFDWHTEGEYRQFVTGYGYDVMTWRGYPVLRDIREFLMVAWLAQNTRESETIAAEFARRVADLRAGDGRRDWSPF